MDISKITNYLYVSSRLQTGHIEELTARNISLVISMIGSQRPPDIFTHPPFHLLWLQTFDSILMPIPMTELIKGVQIALPAIQSGGSILVYCAKGRHRSVAMATAILISMDYAAHDAMELIRLQRMAADPQAWHISQRIHKFENYWQNRINQTSNDIEETYAEIATSLLSQWMSGKTRKKLVSNI